jgi:hypothetical protein
VHRHVVGFAEEGRQVSGGRVQLALDSGVGLDRIVVEHAHAESLGPTRHRAPDPAETDDAQCLAVDVGPPQQSPSPGLPLAGADVGVGFHDAPAGRHEQSPGEVGGGLGEDVGRVGDDDAMTAGGRHVDVVEAHGHVGDDLQPGRGLQQLFVDRRDDVTDQTGPSLEASDQLCLRQRQLAVVVVHVDIRGDDLAGFLGQNI